MTRSSYSGAQRAQAAADRRARSARADCDPQPWPLGPLIYFVVNNMIDGKLTDDDPSSYWNAAGCMHSVPSSGGYYYAIFDLGATSTISALRMAATPSATAIFK